MRVYKYAIDVYDYLTLDLPDGAKILSVAEQHGDLYLWALVDPDQPMRTRHLRVAGTGHPIDEHAESLTFIGTAMMHGGSLVFHVFELALPA